MLSFLSERLSRGRKPLTLVGQYPEVVLRYVVFVSHEHEGGVMCVIKTSLGNLDEGCTRVVYDLRRDRAL